MRKAWLKSNSICLAMGDATALNLMFETKRDHILFLDYWKKYMGKMATLINYHLTPTGWVLLFKTRSEKEIEDAYHELRNQSSKAKKKNTLTEVQRMLSEHFRILLSQYVRRSNAINKRRGSKVLQRFNKYILNEQADYEDLFHRLTKRIRRNPQSEKKYEADESQYDLLQEMEKDSPWKVGLDYIRGMRLDLGCGMGLN